MYDLGIYIYTKTIKKGILDGLIYKFKKELLSFKDVYWNRQTIKILM
jgi:hypothetical protein